MFVIIAIELTFILHRTVPMCVQGSKSYHQLNVTMVIPYNWQPSLCSNDFTPCQTVQVNACIEFFGPKSIFPRSR